jgi:hypothetical protein
MQFRLLIAIVGLALMVGACNSSSNTANSNANRSNGMTNIAASNTNTAAVVTNANSTSANKWNSNISREEYEKNRGEYEKGKRPSESVGQSVEDSWLWFKTRSALATTSDLRDSTIDVDVTNGVITLKGTVETAAQKTKAKQVADGIEGKKSVVDQLKVSANDSMTNTSGNSSKSANTHK